MANDNDLLKILENAVNNFDDALPAAQEKMLLDILEITKSFDTRKDGSLSMSVKNIRMLAAVKKKIQKTILSKKYVSSVKKYIKAFNEIDKFHNAYFKEIEAGFTAPELVKVLKEQTIKDTVDLLTEKGVGVNISDAVYSIIKTNITTGVSYAQLSEQLRTVILTTETPGILERYVKQIATDAVNQYSAQYNATVSSDLGFEWYRYDGRDITTTRPFCDAMTDQPYFHVSEIPRLLKAQGLTYEDKQGKRVPVPVNDKTGLPGGFYPETDVSNFMILRGGYNCRHQVRPISERRVPKDVVDRVKATAAYRLYKAK